MRNTMDNAAKTHIQSQSDDDDDDDDNISFLSPLLRILSP
jgi:hypothetical protein